MAAVEQQLEARYAILDELKHHLTWAQEKMKASTDKHRRDVKFELGVRYFLNFSRIVINLWLGIKMKSLHLGFMGLIK